MEFWYPSWLLALAGADVLAVTVIESYCFSWYHGFQASRGLFSLPGFRCEKRTIRTCTHAHGCTHTHTHRDRDKQTDCSTVPAAAPARAMLDGRLAISRTRCGTRKRGEICIDCIDPVQRLRDASAFTELISKFRNRTLGHSAFFAFILRRCSFVARPEFPNFPGALRALYRLPGNLESQLKDLVWDNCLAPALQHLWVYGSTFSHIF